MDRTKVYIAMLHYFLGTRKPIIVYVSHSKTHAEKIGRQAEERYGGGYILEITEAIIDKTNSIKIWLKGKSPDHNISCIKDIYDSSVKKF